MNFKPLSHETITKMKLIWLTGSKKENPSSPFPGTIPETMSPTAPVAASNVGMSKLSLGHTETAHTSLSTTLDCLDQDVACDTVSVSVWHLHSISSSWGANGVGGSRGKSSAGRLIELEGLRFVADCCFDKWRKMEQLCWCNRRSGLAIGLRGCLFLVIWLTYWLMLLNWSNNRWTDWTVSYFPSSVSSHAKL